MSRLRVLVLVHEDCVPPDSMDGHSEKEIAEWKVEFDVITSLREMGHDVRPLGVYDELRPIREAIEEWKPQIVFMLLEQFHGVRAYDQAVVSYLELSRQAYTGCNPTGLLLSRDKALTKEIFSFHRIPTPRFAVIPMGRRPRRPGHLSYPLIVKAVTEDASFAMSQASIVHDDGELAERAEFVHKRAGAHAIVEQYIEGRELYVGLLGNVRLEALPIWEMSFGRLPEEGAPIATAKVKWDAQYREKHGIHTALAKDLGPELEARIASLCKRAYRVLKLTGYARMDLRLAPDGAVYIIEANANPNLEYGEDFAESAEAVGISYDNLIRRIISLGLRYRARWRG